MQETRAHITRLCFEWLARLRVLPSTVSSLRGPDTREASVLVRCDGDNAVDPSDRRGGVSFLCGGTFTHVMTTVLSILSKLSIFPLVRVRFLFLLSGKRTENCE